MITLKGFVQRHHFDAFVEPESCRLHHEQGHRLLQGWRATPTRFTADAIRLARSNSKGLCTDPEARPRGSSSGPKAGTGKSADAAWTHRRRTRRKPLAQSRKQNRLFGYQRTPVKLTYRRRKKSGVFSNEASIPQAPKRAKTNGKRHADRQIQQTARTRRTATTDATRRQENGQPVHDRGSRPLFCMLARQLDFVARESR